LSHSSTGSILDRACINQLASSNSSPSSRSIVLKASVILIKGLPIYGIKVEGLVLLGKAAKRLSNSAVVLNKALIEVIEA